jgi:hypothetical protein
MNWYKKAQQRYLWNNDPDLPYANQEWEPSGILEQDIEQCRNENELMRVFNAYNFKGGNIDEEVFHEGQKVYVFNYGNGRFIVEASFPYPSMERAELWIDQMSEMDLYGYIDSGDFNKSFWDSVDLNDKVYHGTSKDRVTDILRNGLEPRSETRGIENKYTPSGIFTSDIAEKPDSYYDVVLEINIGQMKQDGYMPEISQEEPITEKELRETLANRIGLKGYYSDYANDYDPETIIFYGMIPPKYIRVYQ